MQRQTEAHTLLIESLLLDTLSYTYNTFYGNWINLFLTKVQLPINIFKKKINISVENVCPPLIIIDVWIHKRRSFEKKFSIKSKLFASVDDIEL